MERKINLGGKEFTYKIRYQLSYNLLKYRNRLMTGFDFSEADRDVVEEILNMRDKIEKSGTENNELELLKELSPKALKFLQNQQKDTTLIFNEDETIDIVSTLTGIEDRKEILDILDVEVEEHGIDKLIEKLMNAISEVFTNAKDNSKQKEIKE